MILKHQLLSKYGSNMDWQNLDDMPYRDIILMQLCMIYENKASNMKNDTENFYSS